MNLTTSPNIDVRFIAILIIMWICPSLHNLAAQAMVKGSIKAYKGDLTFDRCVGCVVIPIDSTKRDTGNFECFGIVGSDENFILKDVSKKTTFLKLSRSGFYNTIVENVEFSGDTIVLKDIPMFEQGCSFYSHVLCTKKYFWGLLKITRGCQGIECHKEEPFNLQGNKISLTCIDCSQDSIICELSKNNSSNIKIQYRDIRACSNNLLTKEKK